MKRKIPLVVVVLALFLWPAFGQTKSHNITLTWTASTSTVSGYNIYRSTTSGSGYTKIGTSTTTSFVDSSGTGATKYFYVATAFDSGGFESANSNETSATFIANPNPPQGLAAVAQ